MASTADVFRPGDTPIAWIALAVASLRFSDENSNPRSLDQQLLNVLNRARRDGVFVPWQYVLADAAVSGTLACRTGYTLAKTIIERRADFGPTDLVGQHDPQAVFPRAARRTRGVSHDATGEEPDHRQSPLRKAAAGPVARSGIAAPTNSTRRGGGCRSREAQAFGSVVRQPIPSTKKLDQEIANEDRQLKRLTDRLARLDDTHLDAVLAKAEEMGRQLAAKREQLKELQRAGRRRNVKSVKEKDVVAALTQLRDLLHGDIGVTAQVLKALVGDVILETRQVEGQAKPHMVARFTINAVPAAAASPTEAIVPLIYDRSAAARKPRKTKLKS